MEMKEESQYYAKIKELSEKCMNEKETISRADVVAILREDFKVAIVDGFDFDAVIYRAYLHYNCPKSIRMSIVSNTDGKSIVDQYAIYLKMINESPKKIFPNIEENLNTTKDQIEEATQSFEEVLKLKLIESAATLVQELKGTEGIEKIRAKGEALMTNYGKMVDTYSQAKEMVQTNVHDFVVLRSAVNDLFMRYAMALVDVFGESIKVVSPRLFNFNNIQWLNVTAMQKDVELQFHQLDEKCVFLLGEIGKHFDASTRAMQVGMRSTKALGGKSGVYGSLVMGAFTFLNHWLDAKEKTTQMQTQYLMIEDSVKHDRMQISADMKRLATIHKVMNDLYIPQIQTFFRYADQVLSDDLKQLLDQIYTPETLPLKQERERLIQRCRALENAINDHEENISIFKRRLIDWKSQLNSQRKAYQNAKSLQPISPSVLTNIVTLGSAQTEYHKKLMEWKVTNGQFIDTYDDMLADVDETAADMQDHVQQLQKDKVAYEQCRKDLNELNRQMMEKLRVCPEQKSRLLKHLNNMVSLLNVGKTISENRLDDSLTIVVDFPKVDENMLVMPDILAENVRSFVDNLCEELKCEGLGKTSRNESEETHDASSSTDDKSESEEDEKEGERMIETVGKVTSLIQQLSYLQTEKMKRELTDTIYRSEIEKLKNEFQQTMEQIDKKSATLFEAVKKANSAMTQEELRTALLTLTDTRTTHWTNEDFEAFLKGEKQIEL